MNQIGILFSSGRFAELERLALSITGAYPGSGIFWKALGIALQSQKKDCVDALRKAAQLLPDDAENHKNLGFALQQLGRLPEAEICHRRATKLKPNLPESHKNLGVVLKDQGKLKEAETFFRKASELSPDYFDARIWLGSTLYDQGRFAEAESSYRAAVELKPDSPHALRNLGLPLKQQGRFAEAESAFRRALEINPEYAVCYLDLGTMLKEQNRLEESAACLMKCLELEPEDSLGCRLLLAQMDSVALPARASEAFLDKLYSARAGIWDAGNNENTYRGAELVAQALRQLLLGSGKVDILDAGCGTGMVGSLIKDITNRLDGVDNSQAMLKMAGKKKIYDMLVKGDIESFMGNNPSEYDAVACAATLIHFGDLSTVFKAAAACLKDNGLFVLTLFPNNNETTAKEVIVADIDEYAKGGCFAHGRGYIRRIAESAGLIVEVIKDEIHEYFGQIPVMGLLVALRKSPKPMGSMKQ